MILYLLKYTVEGMRKAQPTETVIAIGIIIIVLTSCMIWGSFDAKKQAEKDEQEFVKQILNNGTESNDRKRSV